MTAIDLAWSQFAFVVSFHIIFSAFSIGLASYLAVLEGLWLRTGRSIYLATFNYWLRIFAVVFGMGVVSGIEADAIKALYGKTADNTMF
jgi:cytochrome bd ubiquinol oxidase subunit I